MHQAQAWWICNTLDGAASQNGKAFFTVSIQQPHVHPYLNPSPCVTIVTTDSHNPFLIQRPPRTPVPSTTSTIPRTVCPSRTTGPPLTPRACASSG
jgi:hypothetical protein